ncbi:DUF4236 domain-containing protein [Arthrobacter sunyaminii]|uniref:DUF4236 domain-containing protein n=1 Tax=Arthrobacter sunyaminii TaxID=2816859 RepID=A0A975XLF6_9MICC|nr:DUF4236 domain-containing protein [Arthrobacter sunyaminii]MBO0907805.1 DUF4236 domain-containing protein [Arthrobacter sunyaminii]QWQ36863.1 DUF4236 domain-containing protein [Arthrobacter sunyaminii]
MGFRVRKSFKIAPGIRLTVTPKTIGISAGVKGARISANSSGRVTRTVGLPGTGIYHTETLSSGNSSRRPQPSHRSKSSRRTTPAATRPASKPIPAPQPPTPGLFAPKWEKELYKAVLGSPDYASLASIGADYPPARPLASLLEATLVSVPAGDIQRGLELMSWLFSTGYDPARDEFVQKYLPDASFTLAVADGVTVQLPPTRNLIGLLLGELLQAADNISAAVDVVEQVEPGTVAAVSLAELYAKQGRWDDVVDLTEGLSNVDEAATFLLIQRGMAFRELGYFDAARESFKEALRIRSRPPELRQRALVERGLTHLRDGKRSMARKDFEKVLAENSSYPGLREHLASMQD